MRRIVFLLLIVNLVACKKDEAADPCTSGTAMPALTIGDNRESNMLATHFWVIEHYVASDPAQFEAKKSNRGRWYKFNKDGTFQSGHWETQGCSGTWRMDYSTQYPLVIIDSYNDAEDFGWHIYSATPDMSEVSWVGAEGYPNYTDMVKTINLMSMPTKKQFGDE